MCVGGSVFYVPMSAKVVQNPGPPNRCKQWFHCRGWYRQQDTPGNIHDIYVMETTTRARGSYNLVEHVIQGDNTTQCDATFTKRHYMA